MPAARAARGEPSRTGPPSAKAMLPASGATTPVRILTIVDLPLPFSPITACTLPYRMVRLHALSARVSP